MKRGQMKRGSGFSLVEIVSVVLLLGLSMGAIMQTLRAGTRQSLKGMQQIEVSLEARRILQRLQNDLKSACFETNQIAAIDISVTAMLQQSGTFPRNAYSFLSFPLNGTVADVIPTAADASPAYRRASRVTWRLEPGPDPRRPLLRLIREEVFHPEHSQAKTGSPRLSRVMSERVNYFAIQPYQVTSGGQSNWYFWVTLQLGDAITRNTGSFTPGQPLPEKREDLVMADFYDVVSPDFFNAVWKFTELNRNWYTGVQGPP